MRYNLKGLGTKKENHPKTLEDFFSGAGVVCLHILINDVIFVVGTSKRVSFYSLDGKMFNAEFQNVRITDSLYQKLSTDSEFKKYFFGQKHLISLQLTGFPNTKIVIRDIRFTEVNTTSSLFCNKELVVCEENKNNTNVKSGFTEVDFGATFEFYGFSDLLGSPVDNLPTYPKTID